MLNYRTKVPIKLTALILIQIFLFTGAACPDSLRVPMMYKTGIANQREPLMQKDGSGEAALNLNVFNRILREVSEALREKGIEVTPIIMGSAVYLADEEGFVKFSAIEDIDIALATNRGAPGDYLDPFLRELMKRLLSFVEKDKGLLRIWITSNPPRIFLEAGGATRIISTPAGGPDLAELFIRTVLQHPTRDSEDYNKRSKRALAILYYAGTFFHAEDKERFSRFRTMYLDSYQDKPESTKQVMLVIEQQALEVQEQYKILEESNNPDKLMAFKEHVRNMIGAPDYRTPEGTKESLALDDNASRRDAVKNMAIQLAVASERGADMANQPEALTAQRQHETMYDNKTVMERRSPALRAALFLLKAGSYLWYPIFTAVLILGPTYGIVTERSTLWWGLVWAANSPAIITLFIFEPIMLLPARLSLARFFNPDFYRGYYSKSPEDRVKFIFERIKARAIQEGDREVLDVLSVVKKFRIVDEFPEKGKVFHVPTGELDISRDMTEQPSLVQYMIMRRAKMMWYFGQRKYREKILYYNDLYFETGEFLLRHSKYINIYTLYQASLFLSEGSIRRLVGWFSPSLSREGEADGMGMGVIYTIEEVKKIAQENIQRGKRYSVNEFAEEFYFPEGLAKELLAELNEPVAALTRNASVSVNERQEPASNEAQPKAGLEQSLIIPAKDARTGI